jgi:hypothetical protein
VAEYAKKSRSVAGRETVKKRLKLLKVIYKANGREGQL